MLVQWFEFIVRIIKTICLSAVYTSVLLVLILFLFKKIKNKWGTKSLRVKVRYFLLIHFLLSIALFSYSFSYWEDVGLGESPSLPIGYEQRIYSPDYQWTDFYPDLNKQELNKDELVIDSFIVSNRILCATISHSRSVSPTYDFIVCDLVNKTSQPFLKEADYNVYAQAKRLPYRQAFSDFITQRNNYIAARPKWKQWLLP